MLARRRRFLGARDRFGDLVAIKRADRAHQREGEHVIDVTTGQVIDAVSPVRLLGDEGARKSVVSGKCVSVRVEPGGNRINHKKEIIYTHNKEQTRQMKTIKVNKK